jgi:hypothetical protein
MLAKPHEMMVGYKADSKGPIGIVEKLPKADSG